MMKVRYFLTRAAWRSLALAACNKNNEQGQRRRARRQDHDHPAAPPAGGTWADVVNETSAGGY